MKPAELAGRFLAWLVGIGEEGMSWHLTHRELWYENQAATLKLKGKGATRKFDKAISASSGEPGLETIYERRLA